MSVSAIAMLGATNLLTSMTYAQEATNYGDFDGIQFPLGAEAKRFSFNMPDHDVWLYAVIEANKYTVTYQWNNATSWEMSWTVFTYDATWEKLDPNQYSRTWYNFGWWNTGEGGTGGTHYEDEATVSNWTTQDWATIPIYAEWRARRYSITYDLADAGSNSKAVSGNDYPLELDYDQEWTILPPTRSWYSFSGWHITDMDGETHIIDGSGVNATELDHENATRYEALRADTGTVNFAARWTALDSDYTVNHFLETFVDGVYESGAYLTQTGAAPTDSIVEPPVDHPEWFTAPSTKTGLVESDGSLTINYQYIRNSYGLTIVAETGIALVSASGSVTAGDSTNTEKTIQFKYQEPITVDFELADGYTWGYWTGFAEGDSSFNMPATGVTKIAKAMPIVYTITYHPNWWTNNPSNPTEYTKESDTITLLEATGTNSIFVWWTGSNGPEAQKNPTIQWWSTGDKVYYAEWKCYTWYHDINGTNTGNTNYGNCIANTDTTYTINYFKQNLEWWDSYASAGSGTGVGTTDTDTNGRNYVDDIDHVWFTVYSVDTGTIKWDGSTEIEIKYNRNSYNKDVQDGAGIITTVVGAHDSAAAASWQHQYGDTVTLTESTKPGYTFDHWTVEGSWFGPITLTSGNNTFTMPASDVVIKSYSTTNKYTLHLTKYWGTGTLDDGYEYTVEDTVTLTELRRDNSTFLWWSWMWLASPQQTVTFSGRAEDSTYEAIWECNKWYHEDGTDRCEANKYDVVVNYNDDETNPTTEHFTYDITWYIDNPEQSWYDFAWWDVYWMSEDGETHYLGTVTTTASGATGIMWSGFKNLTTVESGTVTFQARWTARDDTKYTVYHYYMNVDGTGYYLSWTDVLSWTTSGTIYVSGHQHMYPGFTGYAWYTAWDETGPDGLEVTSVVIDKKGNTVIYIFYQRGDYTVHLGGEHADAFSWAGTYKFGEKVTVDVTPSTWYHFVRWEKRGEDFATTGSWS